MSSGNNPRRRRSTFSNIAAIEPHGYHVEQNSSVQNGNNTSNGGHRPSIYYQIADDKVHPIDDNDDSSLRVGSRRSSTSNINEDIMDHRNTTSVTSSVRNNTPNKTDRTLSDVHGTGIAQNYEPSASISTRRSPVDRRHTRNLVDRWVRRRSSVSKAPLIGNSNHEYDTLGDEEYAIAFDDERNPRRGSPSLDHRFEEGSTEEESIHSEPSTRPNSETSSLNDVCFPVISNHDEDSEIGNVKVWPDLSVLQEFADEETKELALIESHATNEEDDETPGRERSSSPFVSGMERFTTVNETQALGGRLRPRRLVPWDARQKRRKSRRALDNPIPGVDEKAASQYRFSYFREDTEGTIHSPNISGLVARPDITFAKLFPPRISQRDQSNSSDQRSPSPNASGPISSEGTASPKKAVPLSSAPSIMASPTIEATDTNSGNSVPFWLDVCNPTEDEMKVLSKAFGIHPLTTEDIFTKENREKVELFRNYYFVCFRSVDVNAQRSKKIEEKTTNDNETGYHKNGYMSLHKSNSSRNLISRLFSRRNSSSDHSIRPKSKLRQAMGSAIHTMNMYIIVFHEGVLSFHFAQTPHTLNVRRRARLLQDYMTVSSDWISYALIDDIVDGFGPMIEAIEEEVNDIEDAIMKMHSNDSDDDESDDDDESLDGASSDSSSTNSSVTNRKQWKKKGDMLKRIGVCRKRVMSLLSLLSSKPDVIRGFAKRCNERWEAAPRSEIGLYLGDIQDHVVTMIQNLNHYEKLLARSHSNYLAQINIDMTKVNNDLNDVLSKITVLGTLVLPMNVVTGLWGMNVLVPGQNREDLQWFWSITSGMILFALFCFYLARTWI